jgi:translation elongation factor EF-G
MDSRLDEQQRGITMKSSAIALKHNYGETLSNIQNKIGSRRSSNYQNIIILLNFIVNHATKTF